MEPKQSARELLREARAELAKAHDHLMELTAKLPMQYFGLVDGNIIQAEGCFVDKIDAYLAAPNESAMDIVRVPMKMLTEIFNNAVDWVPIGDSERVDKIAAKYGVKVEG